MAESGHEGGGGKRSGGVGAVRWIGLAGGPAAALAVYWLLGGMVGAGDAGLSEPGRRTAAVAALMASWWLTEALPLSATALLPVALFPLLGVASIGAATAPYADRVIFLFMGGFILGLGMERWGLHRRIALTTVLLVGTRPKAMVFGFMLATVMMGAWVSNTATAAMMTPIAVSVVGLVFARLGLGEFDPHRGRGETGANFATCMMLGIAFAASIGGMSTLIATPPNSVLKGTVKAFFGQDLGFGQWMRLGVPIVAIFMPAAWALLVYVVYPVRLKELPGGREMILDELRSLGPMSRGEWTVMLVFFCTVAAWVTHGPLASWLGLYWTDAAGRRVPYLSDEGIAVMAALALFVIPVDAKRRVFAMDWKTAERLPWGILLLFGGGMSLAAAMTESGVTHAIMEMMTRVGEVPRLALVLIVTTVIVILTQLTSSTAVATALLPVLAGAGVGLGVHPYLLLIPATMAISCSFMLPVATPPNAIVFASGYVTLPQMARAGLLLNIVGVVLISLYVYYLGGPLLGVDLGTVPEWAAGVEESGGR